MATAGRPFRPAMVLGTLLLALYPWLVYWGLDALNPRGLGLCLIALLVLRHRDRLFGVARQSQLPERMAITSLLILALTVAISDSELLLKLYPAAANLVMLGLFAHSLAQPQSLIERIARLSEPDLPPAGVAYTRRVTQLWCGFFCLNGGVALYTALYASHAVWALYNGFITYLLMGFIFAGEWLYRKGFVQRSP